MQHNPKSDQDWKKILTPDVFHVTRERGTEAPFSGTLLYNHDTGIYTCSNCAKPLFHSDTKFDSGCGWPSFYNPIHKDDIEYINDDTHGMKRTEVRCKSCGAHLGHVFPDGPADRTGMRYCINSLSLGFKKK